MNRIIKVLEKYYIENIIITFFLFIIYVFWVNTSFLYTSILDYKLIVSDPFDWAIYPIKYIPDPIKLSYDERQKYFEDINSNDFIPLPEYDPSIFWRNPDLLKPNTKEYIDTLTQRMIYTVPYMSTYKLDYEEYSWSHPWVDIMAPLWTPVFVIANWVVVDVWNQKNWFWNYVVVKHNNIKLNNWNISDIYSVYAHLSEIFVKSWTKIMKWTLIWKVWQTWIATVPHLHFQIDLEWAYFHPFWPFSWSDVKKAWVSFFDWVNIWLWKEEALKYTINPFEFINRNKEKLLYTWTKNSDFIIVKRDEEELLNQVGKIKEDDILDSNIWNDNNDNLKEEVVMVEENNSEKEVLVKDELVKMENYVEDIIDTNTKQEKMINKDLVVKKEEKINRLDLGDDFILASKIDVALLSWNVDDILEKSDDKQKEELILDDEFKELIQSFSSIDNHSSINNDDKLLQNSWSYDDFFVDVDNQNKYYNEIKYFKDLWVINWFQDNTFRPLQNISRRETLKLVFWVLKKDVKSYNFRQFLDTKIWTWENNYINLWVELWFISKENKYFYPQKSISRVEWLKIILWSLNIIIKDDEFSSICFDDVSLNSWYHKYSCYAKKYNLLDYDNNFYPNKSLTRWEMVYLLYRLQK